MNIKLIATDVDGTLLAGDHLTVPEINVEAFEKAKEKGITTAIVTGRTFSLTKRECDILNGVDYMIVSNGAVIIDVKKDKVIYNCYLPLKSLEQMINIFGKYDLVYDIYADGKGYITKYSYEHIFECALPKTFLLRYRDLMVINDDPLEVVRTKNVEKICINYIPKESIKPLKRDLEQIPNLVCTSGYEGNMEINAKGADKGNALKWLGRKLEIKPEEIMAFGDSDNDRTMLEFAGCSFAMISGKEVAKKSAKNITAYSNTDGGVGRTIIEYL